MFDSKKWLIALVLGVVACAQSAEKPNVVFFLADDLGWTDLTVMGSTYYQTPNIDKLARRGVRFTQAYSANPLCSPTRASILTGLWPSRIGITVPWCHGPEVILKQKLDQDAPVGQKALTANCVSRLNTAYYTMGECFKAAGYTTGHIGKWHLGGEPYSPLEHGFDEDIPHSNSPGPNVKGWFPPWPTWPGKGKPGEYLEDRMAQEAAGFIRRHADKPFYLQYWMFSVHSPINAKQETIQKYVKLADPKSKTKQRNPVYAAMIEHMDDAVGVVMAELERQKLLDNTIIVFTSDNGPIIKPFHKRHTAKEGHNIPVSSAAPLRGQKGDLFEGGVRVPLFVYWPGVTQPNTCNTQATVQSIDFFPTLAEMCKLDTKACGDFDGESFVPAIRGERFDRDTIYSHFPHTSHHEIHDPVASIRKGDWKLLRFFCRNEDQSDRLELYNLATDIGESRDLSGQYPELSAELNTMLGAWLKRTDAVIPTPNPTYNKPATPPNIKSNCNQLTT